MIVSSRTMVTEAEIRVLDVKCHVSVPKDQGFQIDEVRIDESVRAEKSGSSSTEAPEIESVMDCSETVKDPLTEFLPNIRSGSYANIGCRESMDDEHLCVDDLSSHLESSLLKFSMPSAFYGVFDGHGGPNAALYIKQNAMKLFFEDAEFPQFPSIVNAVFLKELENSHKRAFLMADLAMANEDIVSGSCGTTALTALVLGRHLLVANAGDCRAVLCRRGTAVDLSSDHRSTFLPEKDRCEALGGYFDDGYLNGILSVTRALGDWELKKLPQEPELSSSSPPPLPLPSTSPLISDPDVQQIVLTEEDEFLILGCDGIWDVMSSQYAISLVRRGLRKHDDPRKCAMELVEEASRMNSSDNLTAVIVSFSPIPSLPPRTRRSRFCSLPDKPRNQVQSLLGTN